MSGAVGTKTLTSSSTRFEPPAGLGPVWLAEIVARSKFKARPSAEPDFGFVAEPTFVIGQVKRVNSTTIKDAASSPAGYERIARLLFGYPFSPLSSAAKSSTTLTERSLRKLLKAERREQLLRGLSPERRATYERIRRLREEIGPLDFDVVEELRELRENG